MFLLMICCMSQISQLDIHLRDNVFFSFNFRCIAQSRKRKISKIAAIWKRYHFFNFFSQIIMIRRTLSMVPFFIRKFHWQSGFLRLNPQEPPQAPEWVGNTLPFEDRCMQYILVHTRHKNTELFRDFHGQCSTFSSYHTQNHPILYEYFLLCPSSINVVNLLYN